MMKYMYLATIALLVSCGKSNNAKTTPASTIEQIVPLKDKKAHFLWYEGPELFIDESMCKNLSDAERAALGYVASQAGSECSNYDGLGNVTCKAVEALGLNYQNSEQHLGFLRKWFSNDKPALKELEHCYVVPNSATFQSVFRFIDLEVKGNSIVVAARIQGINMREGLSRSATKTFRFNLKKDGMYLVSEEESDVELDVYNQ